LDDCWSKRNDKRCATRLEFCHQIDVAFVAKQLVESLLIRPVRAFDLTVQLRRAALDVGVADAVVLYLPVELRLELMAIVLISRMRNGKLLMMWSC
jgi:hypothetical protein